MVARGSVYGHGYGFGAPKDDCVDVPLRERDGACAGAVAFYRGGKAGATDSTCTYSSSEGLAGASTRDRDADGAFDSARVPAGRSG
jgi:hypothetical protein